MEPKIPKSDFDRREEHEKRIDESHAKGKEVYMKGEDRNGKTKKESRR